MENFKTFLEGRCWPNYKPVPGKKPYSPGSCVKETVSEDLRNWFNPNHPDGGWKRVNTKGEVVGDCAREPGEPKPKCMSNATRAALSKKEKASAVRRKRKQDPNPERQGSPINVKSKVDESMEILNEKNKPTNPELWSRAVSMAKSKFDVYPSAYANGWAAKWYKSKGGSWKSVSEGTESSNLKEASEVFKSIRFAKGEPRGKKHSSTDDEEHGTVGEMDFDQQLAHAKKRAMQEAKDSGEYDQEGDMAMTQLRSIIHHAQELHDQLEPNENLPEWVQSKITLAQDYMQTAYDYMYSEKNEAANPAQQAAIAIAMKKAGKKPKSDGMSEEVVSEEGKGLWANIRAKRERIKNGSGEHMRKPGSKGAPTEEILKKTQAVKEEVEQLEEGRPSQRHPLEGHEYHKKTDAELVHIAKDAHAAAEAMKSHNTDAENKYRDQANDSATVRYYRQKHGMADWYKKKYGHIKEEVVEEGAKSPGVGWMLKADPKLGEKVKANKEKYKEFKQNVGKKTTPMKEEVVDEEVKDEYARKVDKYLKKKYGKDDAQKKLPQGADFAAARRKARLASNGRMDEALSPAIRMQMALKKAREDRERSERNGEAAMAGKFSSGPAKQPVKNPTLVSPKNEEVIVEDDVINKVPKPPFDGPHKAIKGNVKDKSGAVHTPMSRVRDIARMAARKQAGIKEAADVNDPQDRIDTQAKRSLSRTAGVVKDLAMNAKAKAKAKDKKDTFEPEPELSSQIMKQE